MKRVYAVQLRRHLRSNHVATLGSEGNFAREFSLADQFVRSCHDNSSRTAVVDGGHDLSYRWLLQQSCRIARHLRQLDDFRPGMHVGLKLKNSPEYLAAFFGTLIAGGVVVPLPLHYKQHQAHRLCDLADLRYIFEHVDSDTDECEIVRLDATCRQSLEIFPVERNQLAMMLFTSGSSGDPKAVMLSHRNLLSNCHSIREYLPIEPDDRTLAIMPFGHALGNSVLQTHLACGATLVFGDQLMFPSALAETLIRQRCSNLTAVPEVMQSLLFVLRDQTIDLANLKYLAVAGGRLESTAATELAKKIAPAELFLMYGQTEATARLAYLPPQELMQNACTVGRAIPGVELSVRDESGCFNRRGSIGRLFARGDNIMLGYYNDPDATANVLIDDWLDTGDLAKVTGTGQIQICGRANGLIKTQGFRFHPLEVETMLADSLPDLQLVATPVDFYGSTRLALFAKRRINAAISVEQIHSVCRQILPRHMMPQRVEIVDRWPLSGSQKIDRQALRTQLEHRLASTRAFGNDR